MLHNFFILLLIFLCLLSLDIDEDMVGITCERDLIEGVHFGLVE
jgi:hypothetical protein